MRLPIQSMQAVRICDPNKGQWFRSVIVDYEPDQEIVILLPTEKDRDVIADMTPTQSSRQPGGRGENPPSGTSSGTSDDDFLEPPPFNKGAPIRVEVSLTDGIRHFNSVVRRLEFTYGGCIRIEWPTEGTRIQRRDFVRVDVTYRTVVRFFDENELLQEREGTTLDFSSGGMRLRMLQSLPAELELDIEVAVPALEGNILKGRVVRSGEIERKRTNLPQFHWVAIEFVGIDAALRKDLTQLVFDIQRDQLRMRYDDKV